MRNSLGADKARELVQNPFKRMGRFLQEVFINYNLIYDVKKCRHLGDKYIYLYEMPCKKYSVLVFESDDETPIPCFTQFFTKYVDALHYYNDVKEKLKDNNIEL